MPIATVLLAHANTLANGELSAAVALLVVVSLLLFTFLEVAEEAVIVVLTESVSIPRVR